MKTPEEIGTEIAQQIQNYLSMRLQDCADRTKGIASIVAVAIRKEREALAEVKADAPLGVARLIRERDAALKDAQSWKDAHSIAALDRDEAKKAYARLYDAAYAIGCRESCMGWVNQTAENCANVNADLLAMLKSVEYYLSTPIIHADSERETELSRVRAALST